MNSTSQIIINKANDFFSSYESKCSCGGCNNLVEFKLLIPVIKKICEFDVNSHILFEKISDTNEYLYKFEITSKKLKTSTNYFKFFSYEKKNKKLSIKNTNNFINSIKEIMPNLIFNKLSGLFEFKFESNINMDNKSKLLKFIDFKTNNILGLDVFGSKYIDCGECCVCYDNTLIKTSCNHFLCVECWTKIINTTECPYCRHKKIKICPV